MVVCVIKQSICTGYLIMGYSFPDHGCKLHQLLCDLQSLIILS